MNEDKLKAEIDALLPKELTQKPPVTEHPLHMLDNQADPEKKPTIVLQKPIRTYESDVADALAHKNTSILTMKIAEDAKKKAEVASIKENTLTNRASEDTSNETTEPHNYSRKIFIVILSLIFILAGGIGGYYLYLKSPLANEIVKNTEIKIPSIITPDIQKIISIDSQSGEKLIKNISEILKDGQVSVGKIYEFILTESSGENVVRVTGSNFIDKLGLKMPDTLKRSLTDKWMMGVYAMEDSREPFIILTTDFFQNTYAGMLKWESTMPQELSILFDYKEKTNLNNSTSSLASFYGIKGRFDDRVILNRDVREFRDESGNLLVLYSFLNKDTLIISTSEDMIKILIDRIEKQTYIR